MWRQQYKIITLLFLTCLLCGCFGSNPTVPIRYYLIDPVDYPNSSVKAVRQLSIEIIDLQLPQYLERFHIATRSNESQLEFSETNQWGENLRKNLLRTMARNLSFLLTTIDISTPLSRSASMPDYRVQIYIDQFEQDVDKKIKLSARWQLSTTTQTEPLGVFNADLESQQTIEDGNYDQMVSVMRSLYGELSDRIAETIVAQEQ